MVNTHAITGSKDQIVEQIQRLDGRVLSAVVLVEEPSAVDQPPLADSDFAELMAEMATDTVGVPHADDSREAIYTRMSGE